MGQKVPFRVGTVTTRIPINRRVLDAIWDREKHGEKTKNSLGRLGEETT